MVFTLSRRLGCPRLTVIITIFIIKMIVIDSYSIIITNIIIIFIMMMIINLKAVAKPL